jgi:hypothetical protein
MDCLDDNHKSTKPAYVGNRIMYSVDLNNVTVVKGNLHMVLTTRRRENGGHDLPGQSIPSNKKR